MPMNVGKRNFCECGKFSETKNKDREKGRCVLDERGLERRCT